MTPDDTPRGGAGPRVNNAELDEYCARVGDPDRAGLRMVDRTCFALRDDRATMADLRAKLAETERERDEAKINVEHLGLGLLLAEKKRDGLDAALVAFRARADQAEAELRRVTEERDAAQEQRSFWYNGAKELGERLDTANARATAAEATVASLKREIVALQQKAAWLEEQLRKAYDMLKEAQVGWRRAIAISRSHASPTNPEAAG